MKDSRQRSAPIVYFRVLKVYERKQRGCAQVVRRCRVCEWAQVTEMCADGEVMEEMRESHRGMVDGCRWNGGGMGYRVASA